MDLVRDLLDAQLVDRNGRNIGRIDGIVLEVRAKSAPRVAALETGVIVVARRLHPAIARWLRRLFIAISPVPLRPMRIPPHRIRDIGVDIELDVDANADPQFLRLEKWLRRHVVEKLPGGRR